jgi:hypothetical protein
MNAFTLNKPEVMINNSASKFDANGVLIDELSGKFVRDMLIALESLAKRLS